MELAPLARLHLFTFAGYSPGKKAVLTVLLKSASVSLAFLSLSHLCTFAKVGLFIYSNMSKNYLLPSYSGTVFVCPFLTLQRYRIYLYLQNYI